MVLAGIGVFAAFAVVVTVVSRRRDRRRMSNGEKTGPVGDPTASEGYARAYRQSQASRIQRGTATGTGGRF